MKRAWLALICISILGPACSDDSSTAATPSPAEETPDGTNNEPGENNGTDESALTFYRDIKPLLDDKCSQCHFDGGLAPFTLETYEEVVTLKESIRASVQEQTMPPWQPGDGCTDYQFDFSMSSDQIERLVGWIDDGAFEGDPNTAPNNAAPERIELPRVDSVVKLAEPYTPSNEPDDYRCFLMDWEEDQTKFIVGYDVTPDNKDIVHHLIAYIIKPEQVEEYEALEAAEERPGYTCYGGPGGSNTNWLGAWAPGGNARMMPEGTGIKVEPGSKVLIQMHYNAASANTEPDQSSISLMMKDEVEKEAFIFPFTDFRGWIGQGKMDIPAGEASVTHSFEFDPSGYMDLITGGVIPNGSFKIYSASLHMHTLGTQGRISILEEDEEQCMLEIPKWDFNWQDSYGFMEPKVFEPGQQLRLECTWDNSAANQPFVSVDTDGDGNPDSYEQVEPRDVNWGEGTFDEMCLGILFVTAD